MFNLSLLKGLSKAEIGSVGFRFGIWASGFVWTADAMPSTSAPLEVDEATHASHRQTADPQNSADAATPAAHASSSPRDSSAADAGPRDCHTSGKGSRKRDSTENGNCATVEEDEQQSKRHKAGSHSQTDTAAGQACGASGDVTIQKGKPSGEHKLDGQSKGQHKTDGQSKGQHKTDGQSKGQHSWPHTTDGQSIGQIKDTGLRQHKNGSHSSEQSTSNVTSHSEYDSAADSERTSDSSLDPQSEEEEEDADMDFDSLGNIDIGAASSQVLSLSMLQGLKAGLQARLSLYPTDATAGDAHQLGKVNIVEAMAG